MDDTIDLTPRQVTDPDLQQRHSEMQARTAARRRAARDGHGVWRGTAGRSDPRRPLAAHCDWARTLLMSVVDRHIAVMRSYGLDQPVEASVTQGGRFPEAWTDFAKVSVVWPVSMIPGPDVTASVRATAIHMRGLLHHETGHLLYTVPFRQVVPPDQPGHQPPGRHDLDMHRAWNILEDQRMEASYIADVPRIADYLVMLNRVHLAADPASAWFRVAGRAYLGERVRRAALAAFDPPSGDRSLAGQWLDVVRSYMGAHSLSEMHEAVIRAHDILRDAGKIDLAPSSTHRPAEDLLVDPTTVRQSPRSGESGQAVALPAGAAPMPTLGATADQDDAPDLADAMEERVVDSTASLDDDHELTSIGVAARRRHDGATVPTLAASGTAMEPQRIREAEQMAVGVERALALLLTAAQPHWKWNDDHGVIDPLRYRSRAIGDRTYRLARDEELCGGLDLHVSLLCDVSDSMGGPPIEALSQAMYGCRLACDRLGIPSTCTIWATRGETHRVWDTDEPTPVVWPTLGGTDPTAALEDLDHHDADGRSRHLVVIFTDGMWKVGVPTLQQWNRAGTRHFVVVTLGPMAEQTPLRGGNAIRVASPSGLVVGLEEGLRTVLGGLTAG